MIICSCIFTFELFEVESLKGRRGITNAIKAQFKQQNVSVMDVSGEYPKEAEIVVVFVSPDAKSAHQQRQKLEAMIERHFPQWPFELSHEEI